MPNKERILVVAPHCDDETFGCLGTLLRHKRVGAEFAFLWFTQARNTYGGAEQVIKYFKARDNFMNLADQKLDTYALTDLMKPIEEMIEKFKPTMAYIPFIGDLNKDHRLVSEASMVACRPYKKNSPKEVWMYQIPGTTDLGFCHFRKDRSETIDGKRKDELLRKWYPNELINGRSDIVNTEHFQKWPTDF